MPKLVYLVIGIAAFALIAIPAITNSPLSAEDRWFPRSGFLPATGDWNLAGYNIDNVGDPVTGSEVFSQDYGDSRYINTLTDEVKQGRLTIEESNNGQTAHSWSVLQIEENNDTGMSILSGGTTLAGAIFFGDAGSNDQGRIMYNHSSDALSLHTGQSKRATIGATGYDCAAACSLTTTSGNLTLNPAGSTVLSGKVSNPGSELTIAGREVTIINGYHRIDTEADAATDYLDSIRGGVDGMILVIQTANAARDVTVRDDIFLGTGTRLHLAGDFTLSDPKDSLTLIYNALFDWWQEISRSDNQ